MSEPETEVAAGYTIDELATLTRVPSRTIRFYQARGALMAPEIRGRVAHYGEAHVERLKLIAQLQDRGLRIDAIRDLVQSIARGEVDLAEWLGVEQQVQASWAHDQPRTVSEKELKILLGDARPGLVAELIRFELIERRGEVYLIHSPALLQVALKLEAAGIDLHTAVLAREVVQKHFARATSELVELVLRRAREGHVDTSDSAGLLQTLRPMGSEAVRVIFGHEMERALAKLLESGALAKLKPASKRSRGKR